MSAEINIYNPEELGPPMGQYTHVTRVKANEFLFVAGMLSGDAAAMLSARANLTFKLRRSFATSRRR
jgi:enamine deaminase RidA (YjgF/YER057c/UK114 family)